MNPNFSWYITLFLKFDMYGVIDTNDVPPGEGILGNVVSLVEVTREDVFFYGIKVKVKRFERTLMIKVPVNLLKR